MPPIKKDSSFFKLCSDGTNYWIMQRDNKNLIKGPTIQLLRGGGGGWVILKKNILQVHMHKKKFFHTIVPKKNSCTYSGLEKNSGKMFPELTH